MLLNKVKVVIYSGTQFFIFAFNKISEIVYLSSLHHQSLSRSQNIIT